MKIIEKLAAKEHDMYGKAPVTIAFLGDSVTHGCFEVYRVGENGLDTVFEAENSYSHKVKTILHTLFPRTQINVIGAGISGDNAANGLTRVERDVLPYHPDLTVVCFGLNDSCGGMDGLTRYRDSLTGIVAKLKASGSEVILMTPNTMCFHTSPHCRDPFFVWRSSSRKSCKTARSIPIWTPPAPSPAKPTSRCATCTRCGRPWKKPAWTPRSCSRIPSITPRGTCIGCSRMSL